MNRKRGFTLVELLVVIAIIALLISLLLPALSKAIRNGKSLKDGTQVKEIHQSMVTYATNNKGKYPIPGQINRKEVAGLPPNSGDEDFTQNRSQCFYSAMVALQLIPTGLLIGPTEENPRIFNAENYNYTAYNPGQDLYWDGDHNPTSTTFQTNINATPVSATQMCNTSYAHMTICGLRKKEKFRDSAGGADPVIGTRGIIRAGENGIIIINPGEPEYDNSYAIRLHDPKKLWDGNVCFGDNHTERLNNMYYANTNYEVDQDPLAKDNLYFAEFAPGAASTVAAHHKQSDAFLTISRTANSDGEQVSLAAEAPAN